MWILKSVFFQLRILNKLNLNFTNCLLTELKIVNFHKYILPSLISQKWETKILKIENTKELVKYKYTKRNNIYVNRNILKENLLYI